MTPSNPAVNQLLMVTELQTKPLVEHQHQILENLTSGGWFSPVLRILQGERAGKDLAAAEMGA